mgnify:CR=1 FL=1
MPVLQGQGVSRGIAGGTLRFLRNQPQPRREVADREGEIARFEQARQQAIAQLAQLHEDTIARLGADKALLFEIHQMMLDDLDYRDAVTGMIQGEGVCAEYAVEQTGQQFSRMFAQMDDSYMRERAADVLDVSRRVVRLLTGQGEEELDGDGPVILAADDLVPSQTARLDRNRVLAFVTARGSSNSHTAIFARTMGIPAVVGLGDSLLADYDGQDAFVDGSDGRVYIAPDPDTAAQLRQRQRAEEDHRRYLEGFRGCQAIASDGRRVLVCANIGSPQDLDAALAGDADGIGLFRSEFLYLGRDDYPPEESQYQAYRRAAEAMDGRTVVIRTLDIGADKQVDYFGLDKEENPALGYRAIRICLTRKEIFKTQLRALYRAAMFGNISIMFPMIISVAEVHEIKAIIAEVKEELKNEGIPFKDDVELGVMIETPASVMISRELAKEVDFFSVGTNDLTQYTLAIDRQNAKLDKFYDPHHPAVLAMIKMAADNAHAEGAWIGICGELGADLELTEEFLKMGLDELSVSPAMVLPLRKRIRECE